jgi:alpha-glutamyl/putrescinyl thymine pyrophosphorylase-like protein
MIDGAKDLSSRLEDFLNKRPLVGLRSTLERERFVEKLRESLRKLQVLRRRTFLGATDPRDTTFHPLRCIIDKFNEGNVDEAVWVAFLCTHFGWDGTASTRETIRLFYSRREEGLWDWTTVVRVPTGVRDWMRANGERLKQLKFGNHRKYESNEAQGNIGTPAVIESFVRWTARYGEGSPSQAFRLFIERAKNPTAAFDDLFNALEIRRFGRTAKFDLLSLLGNLGILSVAPAHPYLKAATGPRAGTLLMMTGKKKGSLTAEMLDVILTLQSALDVPAECMEDALCNWQKKAGFLSRTC